MISSIFLLMFSFLDFSFDGEICLIFNVSGLKFCFDFSSLKLEVDDIGASFINFTLFFIKDFVFFKTGEYWF